MYLLIIAGRKELQELLKTRVLPYDWETVKNKVMNEKMKLTRHMHNRMKEMDIN